MMSLDRDIIGKTYIETMREIVEKQADSGMRADLTRHGNNFTLLAYAASGNPRVLLKTLARAPKASASETNTVIREYYRTDLWQEHSMLPERYAGHKHLIDWGRKFIEDVVIPDLHQKNNQYLEEERKSTCFFWVHRDAPGPVKQALRLLAYSGIVVEHATGIRATRGEVGTRYAVNVGALISREATPASTGLKVAQNLTPKRMIEFGVKHKAYDDLLINVPTFTEPSVGAVLDQQLAKPISVLDLTHWQLSKLAELKLSTVRDVLLASETELQTLSYVGEVRSRRMKNAAIAAVFEYLSG